LKEKRIYLDNDKKIGIAKLINADGSLNVEYEDGEKKINSGEVSIKIQN
jgi:biotin-(acetyl-CoA carboxylase) ligase